MSDLQTTDLNASELEYVISHHLKTKETLLQKIEDCKKEIKAIDERVNFLKGNYEVYNDDSSLTTKLIYILKHSDKPLSIKDILAQLKSKSFKRYISRNISATLFTIINNKKLPGLEKYYDSPRKCKYFIKNN